VVEEISARRNFSDGAAGHGDQPEKNDDTVIVQVDRDADAPWKRFNAMGACVVPVKLRFALR
jgi:hypothetical protein